ncbi:MAG: GNAT family N-acetyltransferase [Anaerolineae bacterium]
MPDMLVKLYELSPLTPFIERQHTQGITVRRALVPEKHLVLDWVREHFSDYWVSETDVTFARTPVSCFIATEGGVMIGFGCYDATRLGFFGPTGVGETGRGRGTGAALLMACLHDMYAQGYGYAIIGGVGPAEFYTRISGATLIPDSSPGIYADLLRVPDDETAS